jgi:HK97 family phage prohead protease
MRRGEGTIAVREEPEGDGRTAEGIAVPYGVPVSGPTHEYGDAVEVFERGAFADYVAGGGQLAILDRHDGVVVGMSRELEERDEGLAYRGRLFGSQAAADYAERVAGGLRSVSVEFTPGRVRRSHGRVTHVAGAIAHGIAGTYRPAYAGAHVALREGSDMETATATGALEAPTAPPTGEPGIDEARVSTIARAIARGELEAAFRSWAEGRAGAGAAPPGPFAGVRTLGELIARGFEATKGDAILDWGPAIARRALANQTIADNPGVTTPGVMGTIRGIVNPSRPVVSAFGTDDPGGSGLTASWPYTDVDIETLVGEQLAEKNEITSVKVPIKRGSTTLRTWAGGSDISYQLIRRSEPSYLEAYGRIMLAGWAAVTDAAFTAALLATAGINVSLPDLAVDASDADVRRAIFAASVLVEQATGSPASFVLAGSSAFIYVGGNLPMAPIVGGSGTALARTLDVNVSGLGVTHAPHLPPEAIIVSNRATAAWLEEGPFQATAEDVAHLGQDRAVWSMGAPAVFVPAGIVRIDQAAAVGTARARRGE